MVGVSVVCGRGRMISEFKNDLGYLGNSPRLNWKDGDCQK